jgi:D-alanyl-D-alanine endopeptidase (penicillin-binding protein 7)
MWFTSVLKIFLVLTLIAGVPAFAKKQAISQNSILATSYLVKDLDTGEILSEHNSQEIRSIASITKLMTAIVVLDAGQSLEEILEVRPIKGIWSRIQNSHLSRKELLILSLMSSDNLAAKTLAVNYPGGEETAIQAMNSKASILGMRWTKFVDPTGLLDENVSTSEDLSKLLYAAESYPIIREDSTSTSKRIEITGKKKTRFLDFHTTNKLLLSIPKIVVSKTGWIKKSGGCLIMSIHDRGRRLAVILLNSRNTHTRLRDGEILYGLHHGKNF